MEPIRNQPDFRWHPKTLGILGGYVLAQYGANLITPFLMVYVHNILHFSAAVAGMIIGVGNVSGMVVIPVSGIMVERVGARTTTAFWGMFSTVGFVLFIYGHHLSVLLFASFLATGGMAAWWNSLSAMLAGFSMSRRTDIFATVYLLQNLGGGIGAFIGGRLVTGSSPDSFHTSFIMAAFASGIFAVLVFLLGATDEIKPPNIHEDDQDVFSGVVSVRSKAATYRVLLGLALVYGLFAVIISALPGSGFSVWAVDEVGVSTKVVGFAVMLNTFVIVLGQFVVLRFTKRHRRTRICIGAAATYLIGCFFIYIARYSGPHFFVVTELYGAFVLFGIGDTLLFPIIPALVNDLAPNAKRGRYNSTINFSWQVGSMVGPAMAGTMLQLKWTNGFFAGLIALCILAGLTLVVVGGVIPDTVDRI